MSNATSTKVAGKFVVEGEIHGYFNAGCSFGADGYVAVFRTRKAAEADVAQFERISTWQRSATTPRRSPTARRRFARISRPARLARLRPPRNSRCSRKGGAMREIVTYIRVSTEGQHKSGLGEDAQRRALDEFAGQHGLSIAAEYSDTASGAAPLTRRPGLAAAILDARKRKCPVVVARLDRLSRDVHFISGLMAEKVPFVVTAFGLDVDPFMLHIYAAVALNERALISERTKAALQGRVVAGKSLRKMTLESEKAIFDAYISGTPAVQLAQTHGVSRQAITEAVRRYKAVRL